MNTMTPTQVRLFASSQSWIEGEAMRQLYAVSKLPGVRLAAGFPDLHPGKGAPVGAAFVTGNVIYPHLIGGDIGCGMALFKTDFVRHDAKLDRWARQQFQLECAWDQDVREFLAAHDLESTMFDTAMGTIGGGNHFAEIQSVEKVLDAETFGALGLGKQQLVILVHSGSRGLGESILRTHVDQHAGNGVEADSFAARVYLDNHDFAVRWAKANRELIARRFAAALGAEIESLWDGGHNLITRQESDGETVWLHRKGAVAADSDFVVIPGSRGSLSYLVKPTGDGVSHAWSFAHGAGRKWMRSAARQRMRERFSVDELAQTRLGGRVICEDRDLLYEEAPEAYKKIEDVIADLVDAGLVSVIATLRPLLTYKTRKERR
ncbi:MAG TPA: RNA ligase RtcB family protein [Candidatus Sulfotelmatobacter sp.]|jgi:release factor H-coupled RctB family protein|nr:RNA ligase RtcB family protein [Candidatus Sulfotelmatobacter sp.]